MRVYIIGNDGIRLYREAPATVNEGKGKLGFPLASARVIAPLPRSRPFY